MLESIFITNPYTPVELIVKNSINATTMTEIKPYIGPYSRAIIERTASLRSRERNPATLNIAVRKVTRNATAISIADIAIF